MKIIQKIIKYLAIALALFIMASIVQGLIGGFSFVTDFFDRSDESSVSGETSENSASDASVLDLSGDYDRLEINLTAMPIRIVKGDKLSATGNTTYISVKKSDSKIKIYDKGVNIPGNEVLTVYIPEENPLRELKISTGAGYLHANRICAKKLKLDLGAGEAVIDNITATNEADIDVGAGKLTIDGGVLYNTELDIGMGEANISAALYGECELNIGIGSLKANLLGTKDSYRFDISKGIGTVSLNGEKLSDGEKTGNGENKISVDCGIGEAKITLQEK